MRWAVTATSGGTPSRLGPWGGAGSPTGVGTGTMTAPRLPPTGAALRRSNGARPSGVGETGISNANVRSVCTYRADPSDGSGFGPSKTLASITGAPSYRSVTLPEIPITPGAVSATGSSRMSGVETSTTLQTPLGPVRPSWRASMVTGGTASARVGLLITTSASLPWTSTLSTRSSPGPPPRTLTARSEAIPSGLACSGSCPSSTAAWVSASASGFVSGHRPSNVADGFGPGPGGVTVGSSPNRRADVLTTTTSA